MHARWTKLSLLNTKKEHCVCKPALRESVWLGPAQRQQHLGPRPASWSISASTMPCLEVLWGQRRWCTKPSSCVSRCRALGGTSLLPHRGRGGGGGALAPFSPVPFCHFWCGWRKEPPDTLCKDSVPTYSCFWESFTVVFKSSLSLSWALYYALPSSPQCLPLPAPTHPAASSEILVSELRLQMSCLLRTLCWAQLLLHSCTQY